MNKERKVLDYYMLCNKLKDVVRTGWKDWNVKRERVESIAEHIFGTQMLAIAIKSEYEYDIDIMKVIYMLAIHELGEAVIGDLTEFQITREEKEKIEHKAVHEILSPLIDGEQIEKLFLEFDARETKEAKFAYLCDKMEFDMQFKIYQDMGLQKELNNQENNVVFKNEKINKMLEDGAKTPFDICCEWDESKFKDEPTFNKILKYIKENNTNI